MLTKGDDYPIHQTPEPVAHPQSERNFYDRYFFNGYDSEFKHFFACALGVYPNQEVADAAFSVIHNGRQYNLRTSRALKSLERLDTRVGAIAIEVVEPLRTLALHIDDNDSGIRGELVFERRCPAQQEPRITHRVGNVIVMDSTRMTQNGVWTGWYEVDGERVEIDGWMGTRDRSWGVRPVGASAAPLPVAGMPQFYWLWSPLNFVDRCVFFHCNSDADGVPWNTQARMVVDGEAQELNPSTQIKLQSGTRHPVAFNLKLEGADGRKGELAFTPRLRFYMSGIGYTHPEWGHGSWHGEAAQTHDVIDLDAVDQSLLFYFHTQNLSSVLLTGDWGEHRGVGVLEHLIIGAHAPSGLQGLDDLAP